MMESRSSASKNKGENQTSYYHFNSVPRSTSSIVTDWHKCKDIASSQFGTAIQEDYLDVSHNRDDQYKLDAGRSHAATYALRNDQKGGLIYIYPINQPLHEHNMPKADISRPPGSLCTYQSIHKTMHEAALVSTSGKLHDLNMDSAGCFSSDSPDTPSRAQSQQQGIKSTFDEADYDSLGCEPGSRRQSRLVDQEDAINVLEPDENVAGLPFWGMNSDQELTAWGNDLAGIGGHFTDLGHH